MLSEDKDGMNILILAEIETGRWQQVHPKDTVQDNRQPLQRPIKLPSTN